MTRPHKSIQIERCWLCSASNMGTSRVMKPLAKAQGDPMVQLLLFCLTIFKTKTNMIVLCGWRFRGNRFLVESVRVIPRNGFLDLSPLFAHRMSSGCKGRRIVDPVSCGMLK